MPTTTTFGTQILGQTEKALNAILARELSGTGLTERQWVTLSLTVAAGGSVDRVALAGRVAGVLKGGEAEARALLAELAAMGMLEADGAEVSLTDEGRGLHARIRGAVTEITARLWGDLPVDDLAAAGRVLGTVLERANAELAAA